MPIFAPLYRSLVLNVICGSSSFGRARPCQGRGGRFEPGLPLWNSSCRERRRIFFRLTRGVRVPLGSPGWNKNSPVIFKIPNYRPGGGIGRHAGLKILWPAMAVTVQLRSGALLFLSAKAATSRLFYFNNCICQTLNCLLSLPLFSNSFYLKKDRLSIPLSFLIFYPF
jgi:hypothetical protein